MTGAQFVICFGTKDGREYRLHAYERGEGSVRDENHVLDIMSAFAHGNDTVQGPPDGDESVRFEAWLPVFNSRRGKSSYGRIEYTRHEPCPQCVAEAGMDIVQQLRAAARRMRRRKSEEANAK